MSLLRVLALSLLLISIFGMGNVVAADVTAEGELRPGQSTDIDVTVTTTSAQNNISVGLDLDNSTGSTLSTDSLSYGSVDGSATQTVQISTPLSEKDSASLQLTYSSDSETNSTIVQLTNNGKEFFSVTDTSFDTAIGDPGYTEVSVKNVSSAQHSNARVKFDTSKSPISIPEDQETIYLGEVSKNEQKTFEVETTVSENANSDFTYQLDSKIVFDNSSGTEVEEPLYIEISPTDRQKITSTIEESDVAIGGTGITEIDVENTKDKDLSNVSISFESASSDLLLSGSNSTDKRVGDLDSGETKSINVVTSFTENAVADSQYQINSDITYELDSSNLSGSESSTLSIEPNGASEDIVQVQNQNVPVGGSGTVEFEFTNVNDVDIENIDLTLTSENSKVSFSGTSTSTQSFNQLNSSENLTFTEDISFTDSTSTSSKYSVTINAEYEYADINETVTQTQSVLVTPLSEQNVELSLSEDISVTEGDDFELPVKVTNTGPKDVKDIDFSITPRNDITVKRNVFAKDTLSVGETHIFDVPVEAPLDSETLQQEFDTTVEYETSDSDTSQSVSEVLQLTLQELDSEFSVQTKTASDVSIGSSKVITIQVTNQLDKPVSNVDAEFSASSPLSVVGSNAYLSEIESGETVDLNVEVEADSSATPNPYPVDVDFQYDNSKGNAQLSEVYSVQLDVSESEDQFPIIPSVIVVLSILTGGIVYYREKIRSIIE